MLVSSSQRLIFSTEDTAAQCVADLIIRTVSDIPSPVLGLATGGTMEPVYAKLVAAHRRGEVSFAHCTTFNLDEYTGLPADHPGSYRRTMNTLLFDHVDIDKGRTFVPEASRQDADRIGELYEQAIRAAGGIDLQLLGIGRNGHIGFNEPGSAKDSPTRLVTLHEETRKANARFFTDGPVPVSAITMGIGTILSARQIVVLATGAGKADAVFHATQGRFDPECPASALLEHHNVKWVLDTAAAGVKTAA